MASNNKSSGGLGIPTILLVVFLVLKLTNNIDWSWWWVLSPLWIPFALLIGIVFTALLIMVVALTFGASVEDIRYKADKIRNKLK